MQAPSNTSTNNVVWEASPSKWLLFTRILLTTAMLLVSTISLFSFYNKPIPNASEILLKIQGFMLGNPPVNFIIWGATALFLLSTLFMYIRIRCENYTVTNSTLDYGTGVFNREVDETKLFRVVDISVEMPLFLRILGRGHLVIFSNDPSLESSGIKPSFQTPDGRKGVYLTAIKDPKGTKTIIDNLVEIQRRKRGARSTELL